MDLNSSASFVRSAISCLAASSSFAACSRPSISSCNRAWAFIWDCESSFALTSAPVNKPSSFFKSELRPVFFSSKPSARIALSAISWFAAWSSLSNLDALEDSDSISSFALAKSESDSSLDALTSASSSVSFRQRRSASSSEAAFCSAVDEVSSREFCSS